MNLHRTRGGAGWLANTGNAAAFHVAHSHVLLYWYHMFYKDLAFEKSRRCQQTNNAVSALHGWRTTVVTKLPISPRRHPPPRSASPLVPIANVFILAPRQPIATSPLSSLLRLVCHCAHNQALCFCISSTTPTNRLTDCPSRTSRTRLRLPITPATGLTCCALEHRSSDHKRNRPVPTQRGVGRHALQRQFDDTRNTSFR